MRSNELKRVGKRIAHPFIKVINLNRYIQYYFKLVCGIKWIIRESDLSMLLLLYKMSLLRDRSFFMREGGLVGFGKHHLKIA